MGKIKLNLDPSETLTFLREVDIPTPSGKPLKIGFHFKHRTREQMGDLTEQHSKRANEMADRTKEQFDAAKAAADEAEKAGLPEPVHRPLSEYMTEAIASDVEAVLDVATGWEVDMPWSAENLSKFFALYAGAARTIVSDYRVSMMEGRLGN